MELLDCLQVLMECQLKTIPLLIHNIPFILYSFNIFLLGMKKTFGCQVININNVYLNVNIEDKLTILTHCKGTL